MFARLRPIECVQRSMMDLKKEVGWRKRKECKRYKGQIKAWRGSALSATLMDTCSFQKLANESRENAENLRNLATSDDTSPIIYNPYRMIRIVGVCPDTCRAAFPVFTLSTGRIVSQMSPNAFSVGFETGHALGLAVRLISCRASRQIAPSSSVSTGLRFVSRRKSSLKRMRSRRIHEALRGRDDVEVCGRLP
ncbi:hypothetical protein BDZ45DRAFT_172020 [Acephala macrosclerotiorum]|nr:hypothetical protein BDZ45DRAFT_172020 [Acephala macrosclerotiorum]